MSDEAIITFLKQNGPSTPAKLAKYLNTSLLFASAQVGEVASKGLVKMSNLKIGGGSPLYYLSNQEELLQNFSNQLNVKDRQAYELLKEKKVLRDSALAAIVRVGLRNIKDFAVPLTIVFSDRKELFWKWYLLSDNDAEKGIRDILGIVPENVKQEEKKLVEEKELVEKESKEEAEKEPSKKELISPSQKVQPKKKEETTKEVKGSGFKNQPLPKEQSKEQIRQQTNEKVTAPHEVQKTIGARDEDSGIVGFPESGSFSKKIDQYFKDKNIIVEKYDVIRKNKEFTFTLMIPSAVGTSRFYGKAVDKKRISEGDLSFAMVEAQHQKMPALFLTTGSVAKKIEDKMKTLFKEISFVSI